MTGDADLVAFLVGVAFLHRIPHDFADSRNFDRPGLVEGPWVYSACNWAAYEMVEACRGDQPEEAYVVGEALRENHLGRHRHRSRYLPKVRERLDMPVEF